MDEDILKKILEKGRQKLLSTISEELSECSCEKPCECRPSLAEEQEEVTLESSKTFAEEELEEEEEEDFNSSILSEESNLAHRRRILCDRKAKPFALKWCFGVRVGVPVINLSNRYRGLIVYAASNVGVIYDFVMDTMKLLHGHKNLIQALSAERRGNFIVTADNGDDSTIIIWDANTCLPIHTIFNKPEDYNTDFVAISDNGKYLITITLSTCIKIIFWLWTYGKDDPNHVLEIKSDIGACKNICFHPNCQEHIMIAFEKQIMFLYWNEKKQTLIESAFPTIRKEKSLFSGCTYIENCHECMASTTGGNILVFGNTLYARNYEEAELDNSKYYIKTIRVTKTSINCICSTDGIIVTGDELGRILFFDSRVKLLYWLTDFNVGPIVSLSFHMVLPSDEYSYSIFDIDEESVLNSLTRSSEFFGYEDISEDVDFKMPSDATLARNPFNAKEFIIMTKDGSVNLVIPYVNELVTISRNNDALITAIDTHDENPYLVVGYINGKVSLYNYLSHDLISKHILPYSSNNEPVSVTCIKYSPMSVRLACGRENGELWFLDPILLKGSKKPLQATPNKVNKICFSPDSMFAAYFDSNMTVVTLYFDISQQQWFLCGKVRSHYKSIKDIMFSPHKPKWKLMTVGEDRCLIQYNVEAGCTGILDIEVRERIEQSAIPMCFIYYPIQDDCRENYILIADDHHKYKLITDSNFMIRRVFLGPAYGCYKEYPVRKLMFMPDKRYLLFMSNREIGFQIIPTDGNPFNYIGMICHSKKLADCCLSADGKYLFSFGENERVIFMSKTNPEAVDFVATAGGPELEPFYCLIEGGANGWLFSEMKDLFYYMQLLHQGENTSLPRIVSDTIPIIELPDLMKACGYYPSEYDTETLIIDAKYRNYDYTTEIVDIISFVEFVKLYLNHRPANGISKERLRKAFESLQIENIETNSEIEKEKIVDVLTTRGEPFGINAIQKCFRILLNIDDDVEEYLPASIDFDYFTNDILGIDHDRHFDDKETPNRNSPTTKH